LVLPTLSEGSANVCYEAVAAGVPVVTTPNAGAILEDGVSGIIISAGSADRIAAALIRLVGKPELLRLLVDGGRAVLGTQTLQAYAAGLSEIVRDSNLALSAACSA
jgi:glycosyltransferase involved in cell wall biosynthesis